jgi:dihydrofolate reductase
MRTLVVSNFLSVDGVMQGPGGPEEDRSGGFEHGGWIVNYWDDDMRKVLGEWNEQAESLLLGRKTYEIFAAHWPYAPKDDPIAPKLNAMPKYVASRSLKKLDWNNSKLVDDPIPQGVAKLKSEGRGMMLVFGSGELVRSLLGEELIDELRLWIFPLVLGSGKRMFGEDDVPAGLQLQESRPFSTGVVLQRYKPAGKPSYGSFLNHNPPEVELERRQRFAEATA